MQRRLRQVVRDFAAGLTFPSPLLRLATTRLVTGTLAVAALTALARADDAQVAKLISSLTAGDEKARVAAIDSLGQLGSGAKAAAPELAKQLADKSPTVRAHAAYALM